MYRILVKISRFGASKQKENPVRDVPGFAVWKDGLGSGLYGFFMSQGLDFAHGCEVGRAIA